MGNLGGWVTLKGKAMTFDFALTLGWPTLCGFYKGWATLRCALF